MPALIELKLAILRCGIRQYDLAARVGMDETRLSRIVCRRIEPTAEESKLLATALGADERQLFVVGPASERRARPRVALR
ncbi:MAG TPA: helix-turn-helix transcriptional regulator [Polyangiaceae bacterium]|nr:helix-turn-helix transcriptional regulator [Polyangiaceae bacterium]